MSRALSWRSAGQTAQGKRRTHNEDAFLDCPQRGCWAVADGMGGHTAGRVASQRVVSSLAALSGEGGLDQRVKAIRGSLRGLDSQLQPADGLSGIIGSTVVVLVLEHDRAACIWAGDSRCYLWRGQRLYQLSRDHSLQQHLMDKQHLSPELAQAHPGAKALTRAIGARQPLSLEVLELGVHAGDVFLLCSDGLYQGLSHSALGSAMSAGTPRQVVDRLFSDVLRGPAPDDLTAVVVQS